MTTILNDLVNVEEIATAMRVSEQTVRGWVKNNKLPTPMKLGRRLMWRREVIEKLLSNLGGEKDARTDQQ